ncbi:MAG: hypothetical protein WC340_08350 [Kiritimatiellia bacterium]
MKSTIIKILVLLIAIVMAAGVSRAQFSANHQTSTVDGETVVWSGTYCVGSNTSFNVLEVLNGGSLANGEGNLGYTATSSNNLVLVSGVGSLWNNSSEMNVGHSGSGNRLVITNGGQVVNARANIGRSWSAMPTLNKVEVTGNGSFWHCKGTFAVGGSAPGNQLTVSSGGRVLNTDYGMVGNYASGNRAVITGPGSCWESPADLYLGKGDSHRHNELIITNGGCVINKNASIGHGIGSTNNTVLVTGEGSVWTNTSGMTVGMNAANNQVTITDGGRMAAVNLSLGTYAGANSNRLVISGVGSICRATGSSYLGSAGVYNSVVITNGGMLWDYIAHVGNASNYNAVIVSGAGSVWTNMSNINVGRQGTGSWLTINDGGSVYTRTLMVGVNAGATGHQVLVGSDCLLDANTLIVTKAGNSILNTGGIYQFSSATPTITTNGIDAISPIMLTNGIISFRGIANAPLRAGTQLTCINYQGDNGYRLNGAQNALVASYTFDSVANTADPGNYQSLHLTGINPLWQSTALTIGSSGELRTYDTQASISAAFTNHGTMHISNATLTFSQAATLNGRAVIDLDHLASASSVVFNTDLTLGAASTLELANAETYTNEQPLVLFQYTGTLVGTFSDVINMPGKYTINYGSETNGTIRLVRNTGTLLLLH